MILFSATAWNAVAVMFPGARPFCRLTVWPSDRLDRKEVLCRVRYQYRGHLSRPKSLVGIFRQVTMINRDKIVRFGEKFEKKIFATTFFRTEICPCLSLLIFSRWLFFSQSAWHYMCHVTYDPVSTNEIADATRGAQTHCAVKPPYCFCVWERLSRIIYSQLDYATVCEWISFKFWSIDEKYMGNEMYLFFRV